jgi:hypothetical protein
MGRERPRQRGFRSLVHYLNHSTTITPCIDFSGLLDEKYKDQTSIIKFVSKTHVKFLVRFEIVLAEIFKLFHSEPSINYR